MRKLALLWAGLLILGGCAMQNPQGDLYKTSAGDVYVLPLGHGSVQITWNGKIIQVAANLIIGFFLVGKN